MSPIIFKKEGAPWRQGGQTVESYRSGLVKVTDTYITPMAQVGSSYDLFRVGTLLPVVFPIVTSLNVFPEPQWKDNGDGFATITVTSYGSSKEVSGPSRFILSERSFVQGNVIESHFVDKAFAFEVNIPITKTDFVCRYVAYKDQLLSYSDFRFLRDEFQAMNGKGNSPEYNKLDQFVSLSQSTNFGEFTEVTAVVSFQPRKRVDTQTS